MLKSFAEDGVQFGWDSTSIKSAETCLRYYYYKHIIGWQPRRTSVHLLFGGWYAKALEDYHCYVAGGMPHEEALHEIVQETLVETWVYENDENGDPIPGTGEAWTTDHNAKTRANLIRTIVWYLDQFGKDDTCSTVVLSDGTAAVEHSFQLDVDNGVVLSGHIDRLVEFSGKVYVQDQKTTGNTITKRFFDQFNPDTQMSMYTFAGHALFGTPVSGVMIDGAQIAVGFTRFERGFTYRDKASLNEWYDEAMFHIETARKATREQFFPKSTSSCGSGRRQGPGRPFWRLGGPSGPALRCRLPRDL